jgi:acetyltransferase-like isoleucine patch superfamily enzyme
MGAVVVGDIEDHAIVGGIPARALHASGASS